MKDYIVGHIIRPAPEGTEEIDGEMDRPDGAIIIVLGLAGISGFIVGLACRSELTFARAALLLALFCGYAGWCARGVR